MKDLYYQLSGLKLVSTILFLWCFFPGLLLRLGANDKGINTASIWLLIGSGILLILIVGAIIAEIKLEKKLGIK